MSSACSASTSSSPILRKWYCSFLWFWTPC